MKPTPDPPFSLRDLSVETGKIREAILVLQTEKVRTDADVKRHETSIVSLDRLRVCFLVSIILAAVFGVGGSVVVASLYQKLGEAQHKLASLNKKIDLDSSEIENTAELAKKDIKEFGQAQARNLLDAKLLEKPIFLSGKTPSFRGGVVKTNVSSKEFVLLVTGFTVDNGDINEKDTGDIIRMKPLETDGFWSIDANFTTHDGRATYTVYYVAIRRSFVSGNY